MAMRITAIYYCILLILCSAGVLLINDHRSISFRAARNRLQSKISGSSFVSDRFSGTILDETGCTLSRKKYEIGRLSFLTAATAMGLLSGEAGIITWAFIFYISTEPLEHLGPFATPFGIVSQALKKRFTYRKDTEIYEAMAFLKNIVATGRNSQYSADFIIEQLAGYSDLLKPIYFKMLNLLRINRKEEAIDYFAREAGATKGRDFGRLLILMDEVNPRELEETLLSYQKNIKEVKLTRQKQQDELISDLLYLPVVMNVLLIFINFIYVSYFIEQKNMFGLLTY
jgi:hypothetical protein